MIKSLFREPLLHFLILGGLLFAVWSIRNPESIPTEPVRPKIVISESRIDSLIDIFTKTRQRPPSQEELRGLIDDYLQEEIFYREALALKFDEDDSIVRRRLRQKMELFIEDITSAAQPSEEQLAAFLEANADQFRVDRKVALRQIYLKPEKHAETLDQEITELMSKLDENSDPEEYGDSFLLPAAFELTPLTQLTQMFGEEFGPKVFAFESGRWQGPVSSAYGEHLVFIDEKEQGRLPSLDEIRSQVELEWFARTRADGKREFFDKLRARYEIAIEKPNDNHAGKGPSS